MSTLEGGDEVFDSNWTAFMEGELQKSNTENARNLGGRPHSNDTQQRVHAMGPRKIFIVAQAAPVPQ